jgi:RNA polymerase sigma-70 factor (ECF subfamily)
LYWRQINKAGRLKQVLETRATQAQRWLDPAEALDESWRREDMQDLVRAVLAELPADYASLLMAKYLDDHTLEELSAESGGSIDAIKSKLARARREFRNQFELLTRECAPPHREVHSPTNPVSHVPRL